MAEIQNTYFLFSLQSFSCSACSLILLVCDQDLSPRLAGQSQADLLSCTGADK